jgi:hypothetical protein
MDLRQPIDIGPPQPENLAAAHPKSQRDDVSPLHEFNDLFLQCICRRRSGDLDASGTRKMSAIVGVSPWRNFPGHS